MNKKIIFVLILFALAIVLVAAVLFTYAEFGSLNPAATVIGLWRVCVNGEPYVKTGYLCESYVSQSEPGLDLLIQMMRKRGYTHLPDAQMGSVHFFMDPLGNEQPVHFAQNAWFAKWIWY